MTLFQSLSLASWAWKNTLRQLLRGALWAPFLVLGLVQALALFLLVQFHLPALQPLGVPVLRWIGGEGALHYPFALQVLPAASARVGIVISVFLASFLGGVATLAFARAFGDGRPRAPWREAGRRYGALVLFAAAATVVIVPLAGVLPSLLPREAMLENRSLRWGVRLGALGLTILLEALFAYGTAWIVLRGRGAPAAVASAWKTAGGLIVPTLLVVALPALAAYPLAYLEGRADVIVAKFRPELVVVLLAAGIALRALLGFLLAGSVTRLFLWREERSS